MRAPRPAFLPHRASILCAAAGLLLTSAAGARAQDATFPKLETEHIFGDFTIGSSIEEKGDKELEPHTEADFGKRGRRYTAAQTTLEFEYTPTDYLQIGLGPTLSYYDISNVPGLQDRNIAAINGFEAEFRSVVLERGSSPFAVTAAIEPEFHSRDETSGAKVVNYAVENRLEADAELVKNRLYLGFNLLYEPETTRGDLGVWEDESTLGMSTALAYQVIPHVVIGADLWYLQHYEGIAFNTFTGDAVFLGPTFFWRIAPKVRLSAAWEFQVAGREVGIAPAALDLTDFSRERARLLLEFEF